MNMLDTIIPKSDQLNADDLIGGPVTIAVTKVELTTEDQPVSVHFDGDNDKPFMPCKSMRRVMVNAWGPDVNAYPGRSMTLYRDEKVTWGGMAVGGIRISHMSHIERPITMALTESKKNRRPFTVQPLKVEAVTRPVVPTTEPPPSQRATNGNSTAHWSDERWTGWLEKVNAGVRGVRLEAEVDEIAKRPTVADKYADITTPGWVIRELDAILAEGHARFVRQPATTTWENAPENDPDNHPDGGPRIEGEHMVGAG